MDNVRAEGRGPMTADPAGPSLWARRLGFGGLIPFVGLAAALWLAPAGGWPLAAMALLGYGATISSFLGAIHWGLSMRDGRPHACLRCFDFMIVGLAMFASTAAGSLLHRLGPVTGRIDPFSEIVPVSLEAAG